MVVWAYFNQLCIKQNRNQNSIILYILAIMPVFGTGTFANLFALRTSEMAGFVNIVKLFPIYASKIRFRIILSHSPGATTFQTQDISPLRVVNFISADTSRLMFRNSCI